MTDNCRLNRNAWQAVSRRPYAARSASSLKGRVSGWLVLLVGSMSLAMVLSWNDEATGQETFPKLAEARARKVSKNGDHPAGAAQFYAKLHVNEGNQVPANAMGKAIEQVKLLRNGSARRNGISPAVAGAFSGTGRQLLRVGGFPVGPLPLSLPATLSPAPQAHFADPQLSQRLEEALSERPLPVLNIPLHNGI